MPKQEKREKTLKEKIDSATEHEAYQRAEKERLDEGILKIYDELEFNGVKPKIEGVFTEEEQLKYLEVLNRSDFYAIQNKKKVLLKAQLQLEGLTKKETGNRDIRITTPQVLYCAVAGSRLLC